MKPLVKSAIQANLRRRFPGAHVAYPRDAKRQAEIYKAVDALQTIWPGLDDDTAVEIVLNQQKP